MEEWNSELIDCPDDIFVRSKQFGDSNITLVNEEVTSDDFKNDPNFTFNDNYVDSPTFSKDSTESFFEDLNSKSEEPLLKTSLINASLAKKRLQAYSKQVGKSPIKEEKSNTELKVLKNVGKKIKGSHTEDKTKNSIQEIEEIKRRELENINKRFGVTNIAHTIKSIQVDNICSTLQSPDRNQHFKRRDIKQRNYRRTDSSGRGSITPENIKNTPRFSPNAKYPKDWLEYKKQNVTVINNEKFKFTPKKGVISSLEALYDYNLPSQSMESYKFATADNGLSEIPLTFLKITQSRPQLVYSVNHEHIKESYIERHQLFNLISKNHQHSINDLINNPNKFPSSNKRIKIQPWYDKQWQKSNNPECKILENSVGLSFLQNYSDEEDDDDINETDEIIICSSIAKKKTDNVTKLVSQIGKYDTIEPEDSKSNKNDDWQEDGIVTPEQDKQLPRLDANHYVEEEEEDKGILTPEIPPERIQNAKSDTQEDTGLLNESKRAKKKTKRKLETSNAYESPKKKKKKKIKAKKSDSEDSEGKEKKKKKRHRKTNTKEKIGKKKPKGDVKLKKSEDVNLKKKKRRNLKSKSPIVDDLRKKLKKNRKKKKELMLHSDHDRRSNKKEKLSKAKSIELEDDPVQSISIPSKVEMRINKEKNVESELAKHKRRRRSSSDRTKKKKEKPFDIGKKRVVEVLIKLEPEDQFPLEKDYAKTEEAKQISTPDTDEYKANWEKDPMWEIEDEEEERSHHKHRSTLNSSWESDEDVYIPDAREPATVKIRQSDERLDLEIPLNIKPFKKRDISDIKPTTIQKDRSKYLIELDIDIPKEDYARKEPEKRRRWDNKEMKPPANDKPPTTIGNEISLTARSDSNSILENEYEEFMKAVTKSSPTNDTIVTVSSNDSICIIDKDIEETKLIQEIVIAPKDVPFIPMPDEVKLEPVPSPSLIASSNIELKDTVEDNPETSDNLKKPFSFTSIVLPSKKPLLNKSNLKLGDSDDETETSMKPLEQVKRELAVSKPSGDVESELAPNDVLEDIVDEAVTDLQMDKEIDRRREIDAWNSSYRNRSRSPVKNERRPIERERKRSPSRRDAQSSRHRRKDSPSRRREYSPKRDGSPPRRRKSPPDRYRDKSRSSPGMRRYSSRRSLSPRRRSPRRSLSPRGDSSKKSSRPSDKLERRKTEPQRQTSPPLGRPKRSVADSTISDDSLLPQPNLEEYMQSPIPRYINPSAKPDGGGVRMSLDDRIQLELGVHKDFKQISATYDNFSHNRMIRNSSFSTPMKNQIIDKNVYTDPQISLNFVQVENLVQIVPTDLGVKTSTPVESGRKDRSQILQVGNMLQIVPTDITPDIPLPEEPTESIRKDVDVTSCSPEKQSAETTLNHKIAERRAEREKRRLDREMRRKEKENRRRDKEKQRQVKMKLKTENMIKKALQLEVDGQDNGEVANDEAPVQWPPMLNTSGSSRDANKSILIRGRRKSSKSKRKIVQFADGIRPGEGTSPSAGEDLSSPPPCKVLPKEKRYTKTKLRMKNTKKKVKVKIIKPNDTSLEESEEDDNLPPPSPPPGSPPTHLFPPRVKPKHNSGNNSYMINQNHSLYRPSMLIPPLSRSHHLSSEHQQPPPPPLPESPMQIHHSFVPYQVPPLPSTAPPPPPPPDSSLALLHRNHHHFNYPI